MKLEQKLSIFFGDTVGSIEEVKEDIVVIESFDKKFKITKTPLSERRFKPLYKVEFNGQSACFNDFDLVLDYISDRL